MFLFLIFFKSGAYLTASLVYITIKGHELMDMSIVCNLHLADTACEPNKLTKEC